jgi:hypothetical protein
VSADVELVRRAIDAHNRGGEELYASYDEFFDPEFEFVPMTVGVVGSADRMTYRGREGLRRFYEDRADAFGGGEVHVRSLEPVGDAVIAYALSTARGRVSGAAVEEEIALVYWTRGGKLLRIQGFRSRNEALEAAGA